MTMPGSVQPDSGTYVYASDDPRSPMHTVLNLLANSVRTSIKAARDRLTALEDRFAGMDVTTPWVGLPFVNAVGATTAFQEDTAEAVLPKLAYRRLGSMVYLEGVARVRTGGAANYVDLGRLPDGFRPSRNMIFTYFWGDTTPYRGLIRTNGVVSIAIGAAAGTQINIPTVPFFLT
jgi:hypothetical protein